MRSSASGADNLTRLNGGELMLMSAWEEHLAVLQKTGAITSRLFLNWPILLETQQALSKASGSTPRNRQVSPDVKRPDTDVQFYGKVYSAQLRKEFVREVMMQ